LGEEQQGLKSEDRPPINFRLVGEKGPRQGANSLVIVLVNNGLPLDLGPMLLNHNGFVAWFALMNDSGAVMIAIMVMSRADRHSRSDGADAYTYAHVFSESRCAKSNGRNSSNE
jgi:hypothetical protein